jgi:Na+/melibiose symporter-like transporter
VVLYGVLSFVFASSGSYFNGTITTIEKRYKIPSKNMGIISVGNDISSLMLSVFIAYYGGKSHRPRWMGIGLVMVVLNALITAMPHFIYGSGSEALSLTTEYGGIKNMGQSAEFQEAENRKLLCRTNGNFTAFSGTIAVIHQFYFFDTSSKRPEELPNVKLMMAGV